MGLLRAAVRGAIVGNPSGLATPEKWVVDWFRGGVDTDSGVRVDAETALTYAPFFAGVRIISEDVGSLPLHLYERLDPRGKRRARQHPLYGVLHDQANPLMSSQQLRETLQAHAITWGTGYAQIVRRDGVVRELWPLRPDRMKPDIERTGPGRFRVRYHYRDTVNNIKATLLPDEVLPVAGLGFDGIRGYSAVSLARNSIGLGLATEKYGSRWFRDGSRPSGALKHPKKLSDDAHKRIKSDWEEMHRGIDRAQRIAVLEEGVEWQQIGIPPEDAQFLETRKFQVLEQARWLRIPPHKLMDLERATYSNIEDQSIDYVTSCLRVWLTRWEAAIFGRVLTQQERREYFAEHLVDALLRGNTKERFDAHAVSRQWGWHSADDIREIENENPLPDGQGEVYLVPLNMVPAPTKDDAASIASSGGRHERVTRAAAEARRRLGERFAPLMADLDLRIAKMERSEVGSLVRRHLERSRDVASFTAALTDLYEGPIRDRQEERWAPIADTLAAETVSLTVDELDLDEEIDLGRFVTDYTVAHVSYRVGSSLGHLRRIVESAAADDLVDELYAHLDDQIASRPPRTARWESVQLPNATAREVYRAAGIRKVKWVTFGDTCPYCVQLASKPAGIDQPFLTAGEEFEPDGADAPLTVTKSIHHPPAHPGCDCQVVPA